MEKLKVDDKLANLLNEIFGWSQSIRREAMRSKKDGIDDSALIIQESIEDYLFRECNINPRDVIDYDKYNITKRYR